MRFPPFVPLLSALLCLGMSIPPLSFARQGAAANEAAGAQIAVPGERGDFTVDGVGAYVLHFDPTWNTIKQDRLQVQTKTSFATGGWALQGAFELRDASAPLILSQSIEQDPSGESRLAYAVAPVDKRFTQEVGLVFSIPTSIGEGRTIRLGDESITLPSEFKSSEIFNRWRADATTLVLPGATGTHAITGKFSVTIQDARQWRSDFFTVRLRFQPSDGNSTELSLNATLRHAPYQSTPLSLAAAANFGFRDDLAGDHLGGWTDQGAENDIRALPAGPLAVGHLSFDILDDSPGAATAGRAAIVLGNAAMLPAQPRQARVDIPDDLARDGTGRTLKNLYLLHALGFPPGPGAEIGTVVVRYADGDESRASIANGRDVGNWWFPDTLSHAAVGWRGENAQGKPIGLYVSRVPLDSGRRPLSVTFENTGGALWMLAGLSVSADDIPLARAAQTPWTVTTNDEWAAFDHQNDIEPGSAFDFSGLLDAPAGKHGPILVAPDGRFAFTNTPDARVRFWGVNLCETVCFLEKADADALADRLARSGYNSVRIHHYDKLLTKRGPDGKAGLDPEKLDRLDYLFHALKQRGLYINIDLYSSRTIEPREYLEFIRDALGDPTSTATVPPGQRSYKTLIPVSEKAFADWASFAGALMTHTNPYTGIAWKDDPAIIGICPVNEDSPLTNILTDPVFNRIYTKAFQESERGRRIAATVGSDEKRAFHQFIYETYAANDARLRSFLRELGVRAPITGANYMSHQALAFARRHYDYVDNHNYWDHPEFLGKSWSFPFGFHQGNSTRSSAEIARVMMPTRILGKPFAVTEYNFVRPNQYRAEGGVIMPAYASLQDWNALYNFDYLTWQGGVKTPGTGGIFSIGSDPIGLIADRIAAVLFINRHIAPGRRAIGFAVQEGVAYSSFWQGFPADFGRLGLITRIGSFPAEDPATLLEREGVDAVVVNPATPGGPSIYPADKDLFPNLKRDGLIAADAMDATGKRYESDTGEIVLDSENGRLQVVSPRSELFVLPPDTQAVGQNVSVKNGRTFGAIAVLSIDGASVGESRRLLVTHLTDALPSEMAFAGKNRRLLNNYGRLPYLVRKGDARLELTLDPKASYLAYAVSATGKRLREVSIRQENGRWVLPIATADAEGTQLAYEIIGTSP